MNPEFNCVRTTGPKLYVFRSRSKFLLYSQDFKKIFGICNFWHGQPSFGTLLQFALDSRVPISCDIEHTSHRSELWCILVHSQNKLCSANLPRTSYSNVWCDDPLKDSVEKRNFVPPPPFECPMWVKGQKNLWQALSLAAAGGFPEVHVPDTVRPKRVNSFKQKRSYLRAPSRQEYRTCRAVRIAPPSLPEWHFNFIWKHMLLHKKL